MWADSEHPSAQDRVAHFIETVQDYERLDVAIPLKSSMGMSGHVDDDAARWQVTMHAMLLRKYFQPRDKLHLPVVVAAVRKCVVKDDLPSELWDSYQKDIATFQTKSIFHVGSDTYTESEVLESFLYGRYLHGDYGKWLTTRRTPDRLSDQALWHATHDRAHRIRALASLIYNGVQDGAVKY